MTQLTTDQSYPYSIKVINCRTYKQNNFEMTSYPIDSSSLELHLSQSLCLLPFVEVSLLLALNCHWNKTNKSGTLQNTSVSHWTLHKKNGTRPGTGTVQLIRWSRDTKNMHNNFVTYGFVYYKASVYYWAYLASFFIQNNTVQFNYFCI